MRLISGMLDAADLSQSSDDATEELERIFLFSISWAVGGLLEPDDRLRYPLSPPNSIGTIQVTINRIDL